MMGFVSDEASRQHDVVDGGLIAAGGYSAAPGRAMQRFFSQHPWTLTALILIGGALLYAQTISFGLVAVDDPWLLGSNTLLQTPSLASLHHVLFDLSAPTRYRLGAEYLPVRDLSVMLDFAIFGHHYGAHHASQVFLYLVSGLALIMALRRWLASPHLAVLTAALWIAHPLHVESVAWLADRKGILAALFSFGALIAFHRFATRGSLRWWFFTTLALVAALWSKGTAIATPALLGAFLWFNPRADTTAIPRRRAWIGLFATLPVVGVAFIPVWIAGSRLAMISAQHGGNTFTAGAMMMEVHARYLF
ncbi:MAG: glycosyltransferase family 39 protein, partial [Deltaproteobacteria bacterium]|nr:glycosyltransferase family 39 protein [Deltaproteobacteria bacterium]